MRAVATVVMNRVNAPNGEYARISQNGNIRNIIFQAGQFACVKEIINGKYHSQNIYNMRPTQVQYNIADWAIAGNKLNGIDNCLWFMNPYQPKCPDTFPNRNGTFHTRLNNHCFYRPTASYADS